VNYKLQSLTLFLTPISDPSFERDAQAIAQCIKRLDPRFGIGPPAKKRKRAAMQTLPPATAR
jgi:hypothetical protein